MTKKILDRSAYLAVLLAALSLSCKRLIDIPPNPPTSITQTQQFSDSASTMTAIAGVMSYPANGVNGFTFNDGLLSRYTGLSSDELITTQTDRNYTDFYSANLTSQNVVVNTMWSNPYIGLYPVNASLEGIAASPGLSASLKQQLTGELKVVRSMYLFDLTNLFGGIPVVTSSDYKKTNLLGRAPVDSVYRQIIRDLTDAKAALPVTYPSAGRARPNKYTVQAFLSRVYLYRGQWQSAYDEANAVIGSGVYKLEPELNKVFLDGSVEAIWQLPAVNGYNMTYEASNYIPYSAGVIPNYLLTPTLQAAFETGDQRFRKWTNAAVVTIGGSTQTLYYPFKYKQVTPVSPVEAFMVFRLADIYLVRAEAAARLGRTVDALADLNLVRARAGLGASTASVQDDVINAILHERQTELFTEWGNRWFDLKRTGTADAILKPLKTGWQATDTLYPIPQGQLNINIALKQNPGYQ
ncbi:MAG: RagB/SusD family nutrient uptake outer membrane protein [Bacteroidetes bacterium]|nr:RagB/SusD family nutrient uptake outer membrane protein [Bacteroidota bacterium]